MSIFLHLLLELLWSVDSGAGVGAFSPCALRSRDLRVCREGEEEKGKEETEIVSDGSPASS